MTARFSLVVASLAGLCGVILGAFGSHALKGSLPNGLLEVWHTAVQYQFVHALALLGIGILQLQKPGLKSLQVAAIAFTAGMILFSGSLFILALSQISMLGMITPFGGISFIAGWTALLVAGWKWQQPD